MFAAVSGCCRHCTIQTTQAKCEWGREERGTRDVVYLQWWHKGKRMGLFTRTRWNNLIRTFYFCAVSLVRESDVDQCQQIYFTCENHFELFVFFFPLLILLALLVLLYSFRSALISHQRMRPVSSPKRLMCIFKRHLSFVHSLRTRSFLSAASTSLGARKFQNRPSHDIATAGHAACPCAVISRKSF